MSEPIDIDPADFRDLEPPGPVATEEYAVMFEEARVGTPLEASAVAARSDEHARLYARLVEEWQQARAEGYTLEIGDPGGKA